MKILSFLFAYFELVNWILMSREEFEQMMLHTSWKKACLYVFCNVQWMVQLVLTSQMILIYNQLQMMWCSLLSHHPTWRLCRKWKLKICILEWHNLIQNIVNICLMIIYHLLKSAFAEVENAEDFRSTFLVIVDTTSFELSALEPPTIFLPLTKSGLPLIAVRDI